jgi:hypothetical protein
VRTKLLTFENTFFPPAKIANLRDRKRYKKLFVFQLVQYQKSVKENGNVRMSLFPIPHVLFFPIILLKRPLMASYYVLVLYNCQDLFKVGIAGCVYTNTQRYRITKQPGIDIKPVSSEI